MSDLMKWLYRNYILPQIESQPKDIEEGTQLDFLRNELDPQQEEALQSALAFYGAQGFRLGVRTGLALGEDLK